MRPKIQVRNQNSLLRIIINVILDRATAKQPLDRKSVLAETLRRYGKPISNPGGCYRNLGLFLHFLRRKTDPILFDLWVDVSGLQSYMEQVSYVADSYYGITFEAILDPIMSPLFVPNSHLMDRWNEEVCRRIRKEQGPFSIADMQIVREPKFTFFLCMEELDKRPSRTWLQLKKYLDVPDDGMEPGERTTPQRPRKHGVTAFDCVPLSWIGSKRRQAKTIIQKLNLPHGAPFVEVFGGAGVISLLLRANRPDVDVWLNDASETVYAFHATVRDHVGFLVERLQTDAPDEGRWKEYRLSLSGQLPLSERAWRFYYVLIYSFAQLGRNFDPEYHCKNELKIRKLTTASGLLQGVRITNLDFREVLANDGIAYIDPPYLDSATTAFFYYPFSRQDHHDLCRLLLQRSNWLLSHSDHAEIRNLYSRCDFKAMKINRPMGGEGRRATDLLIAPPIMTHGKS